MSAVLVRWQEGAIPPPGPFVAIDITSTLPTHVAESVWRGNDLGHSDARTVPSGFAPLDAQLPGGGWPTHSLSELLLPQAAVCEWRLLGPALPALLKELGSRIYLVAPPKEPLLGGLSQLGLTADRLIRIEATKPADRLWSTEQLIKADPAGAILAWLPQARPEQLRRLQVHSASCDAPVFLLRPETALRDTSPAPLRVSLALGTGWQLDVRIRKRRGSTFDDVLQLPAMPSNLRGVIPPRLRDLNVPAPVTPEVPYALGRTATRPARFRLAH